MMPMWRPNERPPKGIKALVGRWMKNLYKVVMLPYGLA